MATNMITFVLINPLNASAGVLIPVRTSARIIPEEMTEKGTLPVANAIIKNTPIEDKIKNVIVENASNFIKEENENTNEISTQITKQVTNQVKNEMLPGEAENIAKGVVYALTAIILFVVVKIILSIVVSLIDGIAKLPILKQFNEVGGMAYGIVRGLLIICIAVLLMGVYTKIKPESTLNTKIQASFITKILYENIVKF